ncbi:unnamed protein product [Rhizoctonia solani]|uniref:HAT C-terminal dimerisation domain-containing protein n=1 Tax=Rhizoctonia solani TaxID=456999 RepID=A0A8H3CC86_9AGAM|nr:unnamed protein product [Rhizoctonia solani]
MDDEAVEELALEPLSLSTPPLPPPIDPVKPALAHRYTLEGRAAVSNAAETRYFHNRALVYHFVDISDAVEDELDEFYKLLTSWIVTGNQPFTEVENRQFQAMIFYLRPALEGHFVKANAIRTRVVNHGAALRQKTQAYLNNLSGLLAIACDAWTSSNKIAFLAITASWITESWTLKETLLDFVELKGAHDGKNLADAVATAVTELGISEKILALVSDNASNNGTLIHHLTSNLRVSSPNSHWDGSGGHIRCLAHIIHLAVMALLRGIKAVPASTNTREFKHNDHALTVEEAELIVADDNLEASETDDQELADPSVDLQSGIEKIRKISRIVRSSPQRMELFRTVAERIEEDNQRHAKANNIPYEKKSIKNLILDVITRWNSTYLMLERALESSEAIDALTSHSKIKIYRPYALSTSDWAAIRMACKWLKFFRSALTRISGEKYPTLSFSLHIYFVLITYIAELEKEPFVKENMGVLNGVHACMSKLQEFLDKSVKDSQYYYYAMVLDPRYKNTLFSLNTALLERLLPRNWLSESAESFAHTCRKFYDSATHPTVQPHLGTKDMDEFEYAMNASMPQSIHQHQEPTSLAREIQEYLAEPTTTMEPLEWWSKHQSRFPRLAAMARDYLCIPGSSVAVERVLSTGRDVISLRRASLSAETITILMKYRADIILEESVDPFYQS